MEDHDVVNAVEELRLEGLAQGLVDLALTSSGSLLALAPAMNWLPTLDVMMMIVFLKLTTLPWPSVRRPSSSTCRDVEDVGVRLLHLVQEDDGVRVTANGLGELAAPS